MILELSPQPVTLLKNCNCCAFIVTHCILFVTEAFTHILDYIIFHKVIFL